MNQYLKLSFGVWAVSLTLLFTGCSGKQSVQSYWLEKAESPHFTSLTVPASILNIAVDSLEQDQKNAIESLSKLNVLLYKTPSGAQETFEKEKSQLLQVVQSSAYEELMKINSSQVQGAVMFLGNENKIDEFLAYGSSDKKGFVMIRVLGKNMNPKHIKPFLKALQQSHVNSEEIQNLFNGLK